MNKVVLVTGGSRGIGKAIGLYFAHHGYDVVINYQGNEQAAQTACQQIRSVQPNSMMIKGDVSDAQDVKEMFDTIMDRYGRLDVLVNNAGITRDGLFLRMKEKDFTDVIDINLKGTFLCCQQASRIMLRQKSGSIVNLSSVAGISGNAGQTNYASSKAGVIGLTKSLARELASRQICVNAVAPGFITTDMTLALSDSVRNAMIAQIPWKQAGKPQDVAQAVYFLANSQYITGHVLHVDGGMCM